MTRGDSAGASPFASAYDSEAERYNWRGPEVAFGLVYQFVNAGEALLDLGIGTGLGSTLFHRAGLRIFGVDISDEMLKACAEKGFVVDLKKHDLTTEPYPYETGSMNHALCIGVLDFFEDLAPVLRQLSRILRDEGILVFTVADRSSGEGPQYTAPRSSAEPTSIVTMYRRSMEEIGSLLDKNDFDLVKFVEFSVFKDPQRVSVIRQKAYVGRRRGRMRS